MSATRALRQPPSAEPGVPPAFTRARPDAVGLESLCLLTTLLFINPFPFLSFSFFCNYGKPHTSDAELSTTVSQGQSCFIFPLENLSQLLGWHRETRPPPPTSVAVWRWLVLCGRPSCRHPFPSSLGPGSPYLSAPPPLPLLALGQCCLLPVQTFWVTPLPSWALCSLCTALPTHQGPRDERKAREGSGALCRPRAEHPGHVWVVPPVTAHAWPTEEREEGTAFHHQLSSVLWHREKGYKNPSTTSLLAGASRS